MSISGPLFTSVTVRTPTSQTTYSADQDTTPQASSDAKGIEVHLSTEGKAAARSSSAHSDIESSGLPTSVQKILKAIRELQRKIEETMDQIQKVLNDRNLSYDERQTRATALQAVLGMLQSQVSNSTADLSVLMNQLKSSDGDKVKAGLLVLEKM
ncbi:hypothetical protein [Pseudomonas syringae]|uniref:Chemotaxis protein n=1 Tax=Pseudomonas syringae CC1417 TaxID=1357272 RepID=A0AAU8LCW3_PSESX